MRRPDPPESPPTVPPMVREEQAQLARVRGLLLEHPQGEGTSDEEPLAEMNALREAVGSAKTEDLGALFQQYEQLSQRVFTLNARPEATPVDPDCPYFAHLRLCDQRGRRDLFLGRGTRLDNGLRVVDWRNAPISGVFYRYQEGDEYDEQIGDHQLSGILEVRRTVGIAAGELLRVDGGQEGWVRAGDAWTPVPRFKARLAGGEGSAFRLREGPASLGTGQQHRADKHLPEIAALIDPSQFELITRPGAGLVAIRGGAGSGKTTVALHRIAYLAYADPVRFRPERMLVLVWGKALERYVAHVLPALGVEGVRVATWESWARGLRIRHFPRLPRSVRGDTPSSLSQAKLHPAMARVLRRRILARQADSKGMEAVDDFVSLLAAGGEVAQQLAREAPAEFPPRLCEQIVHQLADQASGLRAWLEGDRERDDLLDPEDDALLLRAWQLRVGRLRTRRHHSVGYAHLVVDEVQDFSPLEMRVLLDCLDSGRSATMAGDTAQHILAGTGFTDWEAFFREIGLEGTVVDTLRVAYRSTHPIASLGRAVLGSDVQGEAPPRTVRDGPPVELFRFTDHGACVAFLADALRGLAQAEPLASVALIAPEAGLARLYHQGLTRADVPGLRLVLEQEFTFTAGIDVTLAQDVKGLEFDYVVVLEASANHYPDTELGRRQLHVGITRAIHQLWLCAVGAPTAALQALVASSGEEA
ncbi:MAG: AAA family ATPase [Pseudomonadota bacterium]